MAAKNIPYGITDFNLIRTENYYYVDKTSFLPLIEQVARYFFLIRPRRFGKSLLINMMMWYYDINRKESFNTLFGDLYIGQHPTSEQGRYLILNFNFAEVNPDPALMMESFERHCNTRFDAFIKNYARLFEVDFAEQLWALSTADARFSYLVNQATMRNLPIYLFIDEYDNFTNAVLASEGDEQYQLLTHGNGFFRFFFNKVKGSATGDGAVKRMFITGVSPVTMDDVTSGFNIGSNQSTDQSFNGVIGFSEEELRTMLTYYKGEGLVPDTTDALIEMMKPWYDNYYFSSKKLNEPMYNSDMVLYFLNHYLRHKEAPDNMIDNNIRTDYTKLRHLIRLDKQFGMNASIIQEIIANGSIAADIKTAFPAENLGKPENFKSLLYYFGLLSISEVRQGRTILTIPNLTVREQLYTYLTEAYREASLFDIDLSDLDNLVWNMAYRGDWQPAFRYFAAELERQSAIREFIEGEAHVKGFLLAYMGLTRTYIIWPEHEAGKGYADFYMMPDLIHQPEIVYSYIVEVKYAKHDAKPAEIAALQREAAAQVHRYAASEKIAQTKGNTQLRLLVLVFKAWELVVCEEVTS